LPQFVFSNAVFRFNEVSDLSLVFRPKGAYSGPIRPLIPFQFGHPFRFNSATHSGPNRPGVPVEIGHPRKARIDT
jgi:hypothetical protein